jgi:hypothetical protein
MVMTPRSLFAADAQGRWWIPKDPDAVLDYSIDWSKWLATVGDSISSFEVILGPASELTVVQQDLLGAVTRAMISGGTTVDSMQGITFRITTAASPPRVEDRTIYVKILER